MDRKALCSFLLLGFLTVFCRGQVGIFNDAPRGALDINEHVTAVAGTDARYGGISTTGLVVPIVSISTDETEQAPSANVLNPQTNAATTVHGTLVYDSQCNGLRYLKSNGTLADDTDNVWSVCIK